VGPQQGHHGPRTRGGHQLPRPSTTRSLAPPTAAASPTSSAPRCTSWCAGPGTCVAWSMPSLKVEKSRHTLVIGCFHGWPWSRVLACLVYMHFLLKILDNMVTMVFLLAIRALQWDDGTLSLELTCSIFS
jgi:hypothetical protein